MCVKKKLLIFEKNRNHYHSDVIAVSYFLSYLLRCL